MNACMHADDILMIIKCFRLLKCYRMPKAALLIPNPIGYCIGGPTGVVRARSVGTIEQTESYPTLVESLRLDDYLLVDLPALADLNWTEVLYHLRARSVERRLGKGWRIRL